MDPQKQKRWRRWLSKIIVLAILLWGAETAVSQLLRLGRINRRLTAHLEAAFGRPVEVRRFEFSLRPLPCLIADSITVMEDPRFGYEYFLRAESLTASLRWQALLRGRIEFGTLSFSQPSLNLVHAAGGRWNLENWLPRPSAVAATAAPVGTMTGPMPAASAVLRLRRIEVDGGRINFKRGQEKLSFALVDVTGRVEQEGPGRWRLDLEARPMRAAVILQDAGVLRLQGVVGGTSARLRPADLELSWQDASLSDVLRLLRGRDYGMRGAASLRLAARSEDVHWSLAATVQFRRIHRWDLPLRPDNPAFNVNALASWEPKLSRVDVLQALVEAPRSNLRASGYLYWARPPNSPRAPAKDARFVLLSSGIRLDDLFAWYRAFHPGVAAELVVGGTAGVDLTLAGWPLQVEKGTLIATGARLEGGSLPEPLRLGRASMDINRSGAKLAPVTLSIGNDAGAVRLEASGKHEPDWRWDVKAAGEAEKVGDLLDAAAALGWALPRGWDIEGPARFDLQWQAAPNPFFAAPVGKIDLGGLAFHAPFLNRPVDQVKARMELRVDGLRVRLDSARAFGAQWTGSLEKRAGESVWNFSLAADKLSGANLDRWLNPQWREGLLERMLPMLRSTRSGEVLPADFEAKGQLRVDSFALAPLELRRLRAEAALDSRRVELSNAEADFYGGTIRGSVQADLAAGPAYRIEAKLDRVNVAELVGGTANLSGRFAGTASGEIELATRGVSRQSLVSALGGRGAIEVRDAALQGLDLSASLREARPQAGSSAFRLAAADFNIGASKLQVLKLRLEDADDALEAAGSIDFSRNFDLQLEAVAAPPSGKKKSNPRQDALDVPRGTFHLTGPLDSLQIVQLEAGPPR